MKFRDLKRLKRDHPARNTPLGEIGAEYRFHRHWFPAEVFRNKTYNQIATDSHADWRAPVPEKEAK